MGGQANPVSRLGNIRQEGWGAKSEQGGGFISHMYKDDSHREQVVMETVAGANSPLRSFQCGEYGRQSQEIPRF